MAANSPTACSVCANAAPAESTSSINFAPTLPSRTAWHRRSIRKVRRIRKRSGTVFPANGMVERFNGRIEEVLQSHHFRSGEELETTLHRYVALYNQQLPQSALGSMTPLQAMKDWHRLKPELFRKQPYYLTGCDS